MRIPSLRLAGAVLLTGATAFAGSFSSNFSDPNNTTGFTLQGSGTLADGSGWFPFITNNEVRLTVNQNSLGGTLNLDDLDGGAAVEAFTATFKLQFGPGSGNPADGMSFIFGPDINSGTMFDEEGNSTVGAADSSLIVEFDTYDNGGGEAPAVDVKFGGQEIAHHSFAKADMLTGKLEDVFIQLKRNNTLSVSYKGQVVYTNLYINGWTATNGQFGFNARTGGENEETDLAALSITTTPASAATAPTITSNPQNITINEGSSASFSFGFDGTGPFTFQWNTNGVAVAGATNNTLTLGPVWFAANGEQVTVSVTNSVGGVTSGPATITVNQDLTAPTLVSTTGSEDFTHATVTFSKPVQLTSAQTVANYTIPGLNITSATVNPAAPSNVVLVTSLQTPGSNYVLTVSNVKDLTTAGNTIAANSTIPFVAYAIAHGICKAEYFNNINGTAVSALTSDPRFTNDTPDVVAYHVGLDASESYLNGNVDNYGAKVTGWIVPTVSGNYNFFLRSDDSSQLFLSTDETPANLSLIAEETGCCNPFEEPGAPQTSSAITLTGGKRYYFQALLKEGGGGDYVQVAMRQDNDTTPAAQLKPISGANLEAAVSPVGASLTINQQPANVTAEANEPVTLTVGATGSSVIGSTVLYQWQRNGQPIAGATGSSYTLVNPTTANDNNAQFNVVVEVPGKIVSSSTATLTVVPDTIPLQASVSTINTYDGKVQVGVTFDEPADLTTLVPANFTLTGGTITNFKLATNSFETYGSVVLTTTGLTPGNTYSLQITGVKDPQGNVTTTNVSFTVSGFAWAETGSPITPGQVIPVGTNGFDVLNGGRQEWNSYDEIDMGYVIKTNDFDVRLRVVYAEPGSEWTRVGLQARNDMNVGEPSSDHTNTTAPPYTTASAYAQTHVNPSQTLGSSGAWDPNADGHNGVSPGNTTPNNSHEQNARLVTGGLTSGWGSNVGTAPTYPNAWLRLARSGTTIHGYRSTDGVNWVDQGTVTLTNQQNYMYVGPFLGVETGNIWSGTAATGGFDVWNDAFDPNFDRLFLAQFRDFGDTPALVVNPTIAISKSGSTITINYQGILQSSPSLGPTANWTPVANATSPYTVPTSAGGAMFFRAAP